MRVRVREGKGPLCSAIVGTKTHKDGVFEVDDATAHQWIEAGIVEEAPHVEIAEQHASGETTSDRRMRRRSRIDE